MERYKIEWSSNDFADHVATVHIYDVKFVVSNTCCKDELVEQLYAKIKKSINYEFELY